MRRCWKIQSYVHIYIIIIYIVIGLSKNSPSQVLNLRLDHIFPYYNTILMVLYGMPQCQTSPDHKSAAIFAMMPGGDPNLSPVSLSLPTTFTCHFSRSDVQNISKYWKDATQGNAKCYQYLSIISCFLVISCYFYKTG